MFPILLDPAGIPTVVSALHGAEDSAELAFEQPRSCVQGDTSKLGKSISHSFDRRSNAPTNTSFLLFE
jgi:hypothetical protein